MGFDQLRPRVETDIPHRPAEIFTLYYRTAMTDEFDKQFKLARPQRDGSPSISGPACAEIKFEVSDTSERCELERATVYQTQQRPQPSIKLVAIDGLNHNAVDACFQAKHAIVHRPGLNQSYDGRWDLPIAPVLNVSTVAFHQVVPENYSIW